MEGFCPSPIQLETTRVPASSDIEPGTAFRWKVSDSRLAELPPWSGPAP
jgi:hypothetical protein